MLTLKELSSYSLLAEQGDFRSLCALAMEKLLHSTRAEEGLKQLKELARTEKDMLVYIALHYVKNEEHEQALFYLAKSIDEGTSYGPYYLWKLMPDDTRYLKLSKKRDNLLALRAAVRKSPSFGGLEDFLKDHKRALDLGDFDSYFFCCSDGFSYYKPELSYLQKSLYTPLLRSLFDTSKADKEIIEFAALCGVNEAFPLQAGILMDARRWSEALFWLLPDDNNDSEQQKDIGICYLEMYKKNDNETHLHSALTHLIRSQELGSLEALELLRPYRNPIKYLSINHWIYVLPPYWFFYLIVFFCIVRLALVFIYPLDVSEIIACSLGLISCLYLGLLRVPSFVYALSDAPRVIKHGIRQGDIWAMAKDERYVHKAARQNHLSAMYRMGIGGHSDYLRTAAEQQHIPSILTLYEQEPEKMIEVLSSLEDSHNLQVHQSLGLMYFHKSDFGNAAKHLLFVMAKRPDDIKIKRAYAWSLHQKNPFCTQWLLAQLAERGDIEALFRLQELQTLIKNNDIPFSISKPEVPVFPEKPFLKPKKDFVPYLSNLSVHSLRMLNETYGDDIWQHCDADLRLKKKLRYSHIGSDFYPRSSAEQFEEHVDIFFEGITNLYLKQSLHLSHFDAKLFLLIQQNTTSLEDLLLLPPQYASLLHNYRLLPIVKRAFALSSPELKEWVLASAKKKKREFLIKNWNHSLHPLSEIIEATGELLEWLTNNPEILFPPEPNILLRVKVSQSLVLEFLQNAPPKDILHISTLDPHFWEALAFCSIKVIKKVILSLDKSTINREQILQKWQLNNKIQRLYEDSYTSLYAKSSVMLIKSIIAEMKTKRVSYRPLSIRLYDIPFNKLPESVLTLLLNESKDPISLLAVITNSKRYSNIYDFYLEDIKETGMLYRDNKTFQELKGYLLLRSLMHKGIIKRKMFDSKI
jgi:hypothetical protein